jgi:hypothetical protein
MKHVIIFPVFLLLVLLSLLCGVITWSWSFKRKDFRPGASFINTRIIKFSHWY